MMHAHSVTFLVVAHDCHETLETTLACVMNQSWPRITPVIVTSEALAGQVLARLDEGQRQRFRFVLVPDGATAAEHLDAGFAISNDSFVAWLKAGEACPPRRIEYQVTAAQRVGGITVGIVDKSDGTGRLPGGAGRDPGWRLLLGLLDPRALLVPPSCYRHVGGVNPSFRRLAELDLALRLARSFPLVGVREEDIHPPERPRPRDAELEDELQTLWRTTLDQAAPDGRTGHLRSFEGLAAAYAASRTCGDEVAEAAIIARSLAVGIAGQVTVVVPDHATRVAEAQAAGIGFTVTDGDPGSLKALERALPALQTRWLLTTAAPLEPVGLTALVLSALAGKMAACLNMVEPALFVPTPPGHSLVDGTLFDGSALRAVAEAMMAGEGDFWGAVAAGGRVIGALSASGQTVLRPVEALRDEAAAASLVRDDGESAADVAPAHPAPATDTLIRALVEDAWYFRNNTDVAGSGMTAFHHYCAFGWKEGRDPNPWFSTIYYMEVSGGIAADSNPLDHFIRVGAELGVQPHPFFSLGWYSRRYLNSPPTAGALLHFLQTGITAGAVPHPHLDRPDIPRKLNGLSREDRSAMLVGRLRNGASDWSPLYGLIDSLWYLKQYPDIQAAGLDPIQHYLRHGFKEKRNPNAWFDTEWYLETAGPIPSCQSALEHFVTIGAGEGRKPHPDFDIVWYSQHYLGAERPHAEALRHFLHIGMAAGFVPSAALSGLPVQEHLLALPPARRSEVIKQALGTLKTLADRPARQGIAGTDPLVWNILLLHDRPPGAAPVIVLFEPGAETIAEAVASSLPPTEHALYARLQDGRIEFLEGPPQIRAMLAFEMPDQIDDLRWLGTSLGVARAILSDVRQHEALPARWLREANIPVYLPPARQNQIRRSLH